MKVGMASSVDSSIHPSTWLVVHRSRLAAAIALGLALAAGGGATWLLAVGPARPWEDAFADLNGTSEICRAEGDATALAAARVARSQGQLDNFVRQRFDQFLAESRQAEDESERVPESRAAGQQTDLAVSQATRLEARLAELSAERSHLLERLTAEHPSVVDVDRQIAELDRQRAALAPTTASLSDRGLAAPEARMMPPARWKDLVEHCVVEYDQLAAECRRAERQFEEAQVEHSTALDRHLAALGRWSDVATAWGKLFVVPVALGSALWAVAAAAFAILGWLAARNMPAGMFTGADRLITSAGQIEQWFSLPVVAISAAGDNKPTPATRPYGPATLPRRPAPHWWVLPAQLAVAVAVFCLVATTIQNPSWLRDLWAR
jgi:hypothetical protein